MYVVSTPLYRRMGVWQLPKLWPCGLHVVGYSACLVNRRSPVRIWSGPIVFILFTNLYI